MKIQSQGENNISTYNPFNYGYVGMSAQRTLSTGTAENITLNVYCKGMSETLLPWESCFERVTAIYNINRTKIAKQRLTRKMSQKNGVIEVRYSGLTCACPGNIIPCWS